MEGRLADMIGRRETALELPRLYGALFISAVVAILLAAFAEPLLLGVTPVAAAVIGRPLSILCHRDPTRTIFMLGRPLGICLRCLGIYAGAASAFAIGYLRSGKGGRTLLDSMTMPPAGFAVACAVLVFQAPIVWVLKFYVPVMDHAVIRFASGLAFGAGWTGSFHRVILHWLGRVEHHLQVQFGLD